MVRRILHITTFLQGGAGRVVATLACAQRAAGHDVAVACAAEEVAGYGHYPSWLTQLREAGVPVLAAACTFRRSLHHLMGAVEALERSPFVAAGVDIVHAHAAVPALVARAFSHRAPVLATMHGWNADKAPEHAATDVAIFNGVPLVTVPSPAAARHVVAAGVDPHRVVVVPYGIEPQPSAGLPAADTARIASWQSAGRTVAVCVGTVGARKRQADLLEALTIPGVRGHLACAFLGEADDLATWQARARALRLEHEAVFLGYRPQVTDWMRAADAVVFPSGREGLPIGLLEAQAVGATCVVSDIEEHTDVVRDGVNGYVYPVGDAGRLARVLGGVRGRSPRERAAIAREARMQWQRTYRPATMLARYAALYDAARAGRVERGALTA